MEYFLADNDVRRGPFPLEALGSQGLRPETLVWREGMGNWQRADALPELSAVLNPPTPAATAPLTYGTGVQPTPGVYNSAPNSGPGAGVPGPISYQQPNPYGAYAPPTNGMAIASMILGIISIPAMFAYCFGTPLAISAVVLGHLARKEIRRTASGGDGLALAGLICGYISLSICALIMLVAVIFFGAVISHAH